MDPVRQPRDIEKRAFLLACELVKFCERLSQQGPTFRIVATQLAKSGTSVGANLEEAVAGQSRADFVAKSAIALKEAREALYWLRLAAATSGSASAAEAARLAAEANQIVAILTAILRNTRKRDTERAALKSEA